MKCDRKQVYQRYGYGKLCQLIRKSIISELNLSNGYHDMNDIGHDIAPTEKLGIGVFVLFLKPERT